MSTEPIPIVTVRPRFFLWCMLLFIAFASIAPLAFALPLVTALIDW